MEPTPEQNATAGNNRAVPADSRARAPLAVGIAGLGAIGATVARHVLSSMPTHRLVGVATGSSERSQRAAEAIAALVPDGGRLDVLAPDALAERADVIVACTPSAAFRQVVEPALVRGRTVITVNGAALLDHVDLIRIARERGARLILATGALLGLDAVRACALGRIHSARIETRKPPAGLAKARFVVERGLQLADLPQATRIFEGSVREGARLFPENINVAAALALAGAGADETRIEVWADPSLERNVHRVQVDADFARLDMRIENVPSPENPGSGSITAMSVLDALQGLSSPFRVGS